MRAIATACAVLALLGCGAEPAEVTSMPAAAGPSAPDQARVARYSLVKARARAWIDALAVDPVDLVAHGVKGKKKLGEALEAYVHFRDAAADAADRAAIQARVLALARHTERPQYHNLADAPDQEFDQNSMSYFRVLVLMEEFGLDTARYRFEIDAVKGRMDAHLSHRGQWQRAMFREYYERLGLELPPVLAGLADATGILARRLPADSITVTDGYTLTHQVFVAFDYGHRREQDHLSADDVSYLRSVLPALLRRTQAAGDPDLLAEYVSCATYLGLRDLPEYEAALEYLLSTQNPDGTWGDYEEYRATYGAYLDQHLYLHTTMVAARALIEAFESEWK